MKDVASNGTAGPKSIYDVVKQIDNQKDFHDFVLSHEGNPGAVASEQIKYERHPVSLPSFLSPGSLTYVYKTLATSSGPVVPSQPSTQNRRASAMLGSSFSQQHIPPASQPPAQNTDRSQAPPYLPQTEPPASQPAPAPYPVTSGPAPPEKAPLTQPPAAPPTLPLPGNGFLASLPPLKPVFGVSLDDLYARDGTAVPMIVYQCFQAVELFGLDMEGIYRLSGSANHINHMKSLFDNGQYIVLAKRARF